MDCERFDRVVLDLLYDELDELSAAAARRHVEHCTRCRGILAGLRATREVGALPLVDPPDGLELRILEAERRARGELPLGQRLGRTVSVLAGYAMRPQLAMAATLFFVIGVGLVFFRARPSARDTVSVTERGVAESEPETVTVVPHGAALDPGADAHGAPAEPSAVAEHYAVSEHSKEAAPQRAPAAAPAATQAEAADGEGAGIYESALAAFREGRYKEARQEFEGVVARGGPQAPEAALYAAQATKRADGCGAAVSAFDQVSQRYPGTRAGYEATWEAATCYETSGDVEKARRSYQALLDEPSYAERAKKALAQLEHDEMPAELAMPKQVAARKTASASAPAPAATSSSAASSNAGSTPSKAAPPPKAEPSEPRARDAYRRE